MYVLTGSLYGIVTAGVVKTLLVELFSLDLTSAYTMAAIQMLAPLLQDRIVWLCFLFLERAPNAKIQALQAWLFEARTLQDISPNSTGVSNKRTSSPAV